MGDLNYLPLFQLFLIFCHYSDVRCLFCPLPLPSLFSQFDLRCREQKEKGPSTPLPPPNLSSAIVVPELHCHSFLAHLVLLERDREREEGEEKWKSSSGLPMEEALLALSSTAVGPELPSFRCRRPSCLAIEREEKRDGREREQSL